MKVKDGEVFGVGYVIIDIATLLLKPWGGIFMNCDFVKTTCPFCGCGYQMLLEVMDGELVGTLPVRGAPMNEGKLCIKGWNTLSF